MSKLPSESKNYQSIFWGIFGFAFIIALIIITLYGQGFFRGFNIDQVLISPKELLNFSIQEGGNTYIFDSLSFDEYNPEIKKAAKYELSPDEYQQIYDIIYGSSILEFDQYLLLKFEEENLATLTVYLREKGSQPHKELISYQRIQFLKNGDYFRIERIEEEGPYIWDYFKVPAVYLKVKEVITNGNATTRQ